VTKKEAILQATQALFAEKGFDGTSTAEIAQRAGVAHGTVFHHFQTKENLLLELGEALVDAYLAGLREIRRVRASGWDGVERLIRYHFDFFRAHAPGVRMMVRESPRVVGDRFTCPHAAELRRRLAEVHELRRELVSAGLADGSLLPAPLDQTVFLMESLLQGIIHNHARGIVEVPEELEEATVAFCRRALGARPAHSDP
jgi:AcrR family transcriptional regulator